MKKSVVFDEYAVRDVLAGRKTQMRLPCKITVNGNQKVEHTLALDVHFPETNKDGLCANFYGNKGTTDEPLYYIGASQQPYSIGDVIYVRETIGYGYYAAWDDKTYYKADYPDESPNFVAKWVPAAAMPKEDARLFLRITGVGVQRLQDISFEDCKREGIWDYKTDSEKYHENLQRMAYPKKFRELWDAKWNNRNRSYFAWDNDPWVWVISFAIG